MSRKILKIVHLGVELFKKLLASDAFWYIFWATVLINLIFVIHAALESYLTFTLGLE